ncbi:N-acetylglucosamine-6-phosphate deacetylase [bioreactor metagenome]|uniref:N-acetylglucosamine-6-phosphate deacetylase n=1 Tax=bioreactor metagenome TaxID=1076179 RepID=A0A645CLU1_9ZZZZ|nr:N-acetylglucosamine-6-phosphate deacetylase [Oscillospiraceae bacterium]
MLQDTKLIGRVVTPYRVIENGELCYSGGKITFVGKRCTESDALYNVIDCQKSYITPGFIDMHTHGGGGHDFMDATVEAFLGAAELHASHGTTTLLPTSLTCSDEELFQFFDIYEEALKFNEKGSNMPGLHLEGPYFADSQKGSQDPKYIVPPRKEHYEKILSYCPHIMRWTIASELPGGMELGRYLKSLGILASIGHSDAKLDDAIEAYENGYTNITHFYSGMGGLVRINSYRFPGLIDAGYMINDFTVEIIADGCHLPPSMLKYIYKAKGADKVAVCTDSCRGAGMNEGETVVGSLKNGQRAIIEDGVAKMPDRKAFAASVATTDRLVRNMLRYADAGICDAVKMASATPAKILGLKYKGVLVPGNDADIVVFDDSVNISRTIVGGNTVYLAK